MLLLSRCCIVVPLLLINWGIGPEPARAQEVANSRANSESAAIQQGRERGGEPVDPDYAWDLAADEILLRGRIETVSMTERTMELSVWEFGLPNGRSSNLDAPRRRTAGLTQECGIFQMAGEAVVPGVLRDVGTGRGLAVVGVDNGKTFTVRYLVLGPRIELPLTLAQQGKGPASIPPLSSPNGGSALQFPDPGLKVPQAYPDSTFFNGVKEWVAASGLRARAQFGLRDIGGRANRGSASSDHPRGLALDYMVGRDAALGDAIAAHFVTFAQRENVRYVIWKDVIWQGGDAVDWKSLPADYTHNVTRRHMDHVHVSYLDQPLTAGPWLSQGQLASRSATPRAYPRKAQRKTVR